jgi:predicted transcriptional regulator
VANNTRTAGGLIKTGITLSEDQMRDLEALARLHQTSMAAIIRNAVRAYLAQHLPSESTTKAG